MGIWDSYAQRLGGTYAPSDNTQRDNNLYQTQDRMKRRLPKTLPYKTVQIEGVDRKLAILKTTEYDTKKIYAVPGETLPHGSLVHWKDSYWLITEHDADDEFAERGKMVQCNYYLKWIDDKGDIIGRWCVVEDGTKYLIGEKDAEIMSIGDARIAVTIGKDSDTNKLNRGKRFLIDDMDSQDVLAYEISKPNKLYNVYNGKGVFRFILREVNLEDGDDVERRVADFYSWKPPVKQPDSDIRTNERFTDRVDRAKVDKDHVEDAVRESGVWL